MTLFSKLSNHIYSVKTTCRMIVKSNRHIYRTLVQILVIRIIHPLLCRILRNASQRGRGLEWETPTTKYSKKLKMKYRKISNGRDYSKHPKKSKTPNNQKKPIWKWIKWGECSVLNTLTTITISNYRIAILILRGQTNLTSKKPAAATTLKWKIALRREHPHSEKTLNS